MSCCIAGAGGCIIVTSSVSGIAMGYNYALAEYVDLKETNVSIYLKRGVFDDEIQDDMDWRRAGHMPIAGHIASDNLRTGLPADEETPPLRSGRRLDDSVHEGGANQYEGSLMKLTAKIPMEDSTLHHIENTESQAIKAQFSEGSLNELKAIQSLIDARRYMGVTKSNIISDQETQQFKQQTGSVARWPEVFGPGMRQVNRPELRSGNIQAPNEEALVHSPQAVTSDGQEVIRKFRPGARRIEGSDFNNMNMVGHLDNYGKVTLNPARLAVPNNEIGLRFNWLYPKVPYLYPNLTGDSDYRIIPATYPSPIPLNVGPERPPTAMTFMSTGGLLFVTRTVYPTVKVIPVMTTVSSLGPINMGNIDESVRELLRQPGEMNKVPKKDKPNKTSADDEYEDEIKGLPVRKRRSINKSVYNSTSTSFKVNVTSNTSKTYQSLNSTFTPTKTITLTTNIFKLVHNNNLNIDKITNFEEKDNEKPGVVEIILKKTVTMGPSYVKTYNKTVSLPISKLKNE